MSRIPGSENSETSLAQTCLEAANTTRNIHLHDNVVIMDDQTLNLLFGSLDIAEEGSNCGGDGILDVFMVAIGGGGNGEINPEAIVDDVLAVLPAPARHHILADYCEGDLYTPL